MTEVPQIVFDMPWLLIGVAALPLLVLLLRISRSRQRSRRLARFAEPSALARLLPVDDKSATARTIRLVAVAVLSGIALAGPRWGLARGPATASGIDMAIALDASLSMMATDERPTRLERMRQEVRRLRAMSNADRVALIAFAGRSYILTPLTTDNGALELFLDNLDPSVVGQAGSSLSRAIRQGTELLLASNGNADRALVIMSDGESFEPVEDVKAAAEQAGEKGVTIVTVGFGTTGGSTIPITDANGTRQKRDENGEIVVTRYHPELLELAATSSGGTFIPADASDKASRVRAALRSLRTERRSIESREDYVPRFLWLLIPALLLLLYDTWTVSGARRRKLSSRRATGAGAVTSATSVAAALLLFLVGCAREPDPAVLFENGDVVGAVAALQRQLLAGDTTAVTRYNLGSALLGADSLQASVQLLEAVRRSTEGEVRMRSRFNAGLGDLRQGLDTANADRDQALKASLAAYRSYLTDRPADVDGKWNYELALRKPPPDGNGGGGGGGGQDDPQPEQQQPQPQGGIDQKQAEALLNSAAREEREVQGRTQRRGRSAPMGKDW